MNSDRRKPPVKQFVALVVLIIILAVGASYYGRKPMPTPTNQPSGKPTSQPANQKTSNQVTITTDKGDIVIETYNNDAPKTAKNFVELARKGYYNGLKFHRVVAGFVVQGGDPNGDGTGGTSIYGPTFADELNPNTPSYKAGYKEGVVAMANRGPNTNGSQFFIMLADTPDLPHNYTIFGHVVSGMDVVHKIAVGDVMKSVTVQD